VGRAGASTALLVAGLAGGGCSPPVPADLVLLGGRIVTLDPRRPEAEALAARDGRIVAVGSAAEVRGLVGARTRVVDLAGRLAVPGFIEAHGHFASLGESLSVVDLTHCRDVDDLVRRVAHAASAARPGAWILGRGWHQEKWARPALPEVGGYPTHEELSRAVPDHPVLLTHASGHAALANALALEQAGIDAATPDPPGGTIVRDAAGRPTGALHENAEALVRRAHERWLAARPPDQAEHDARATLEAADAACLAHGVTSFQDAGSDFATVDRIRALVDAGRLGVRLWVMLRADLPELSARASAYRVEGERLTVRAIKAYADGALGTHGAWLLAPYADRAETSGGPLDPLDEIEAAARLALEQGFQLCVHAIGDRANREVLDIFTRAFARVADGPRRRFRLEHVQHLDPADVPRVARLGVVASMQPTHCVSDGPWVERRLGPQRAASGAYVWRRLLDAGARIAAGTDTPVESVDPIATFHAAVTRQMADGVAFHPEQRLTRREALTAMTLDAAYAAFEETVKGSLAPGKLADVTVLSQDLLEIPAERIRDTRVDLTIVDGRVRYEREPAAGDR